MAIGTAIALGAMSAAGAAVKANSAKKASSAQASAAERSAQLQLQGQRETIAAQERAQAEIMAATAPQRALGQNALTSMSQMASAGFSPTDYTKSAAHQFQLGEGEQALERMAAARGIGRSGAAMKDALRFSQGLGSQFETDHYNREFNEHNTQYNKLLNIANIGSGAQGQQIQAIQNTASATGNALMQGNAAAGQAYQQAGAARASGYAGMGDAWGGLVSDGAGMLGMYQGGYFDDQKQIGAGMFGQRTPMAAKGWMGG